MDGQVMQGSVLGYGNGASPAFRMSKRGEMVVTDFYTQCALDGRLFTANVGGGTTPINFATLTYDANQPEFVVDVLTGTTIIPIHLEVMLETAAGTVNEIIVGVANINCGAGTSTAIVPQSLAMSGTAALATGCKVYSLFTGDCTDPVTAANQYSMIYRGGQAFVDAAGVDYKWEWSAKVQGNAPKLVGPACFVVHIVGNTAAPTGYLTFTWAEFASSEI